MPRSRWRTMESGALHHLARAGGDRMILSRSGVAGRQVCQVICQLMGTVSNEWRCWQEHRTAPRRGVGRNKGRFSRTGWYRGAGATTIALRDGLHRNQLYTWLRELRSAAAADAGFCAGRGEKPHRLPPRGYRDRDRPPILAAASVALSEQQARQRDGGADPRISSGPAVTDRATRPDG